MRSPSPTIPALPDGIHPESGRSSRLSKNLTPLWRRARLYPAFPLKNTPCLSSNAYDRSEFDIEIQRDMNVLNRGLGKCRIDDVDMIKLSPSCRKLVCDKE